jgi:hypothetical protein
MVILLCLIDEYSIMIITDCLHYILQALRHVPITSDDMDVKLVSAIYVNRASTMHVSLLFTCLHNMNSRQICALLVLSLISI